MVALVDADGDRRSDRLVGRHRDHVAHRRPRGVAGERLTLDNDGVRNVLDRVEKQHVAEVEAPLRRALLRL